METSKVKCRECKMRATQYEGMLPTAGIAKVLVAGIAIYVAGLWVLVALAGLTTGNEAEAGFVVWWMVRPKWGKVVVCGKCGARYAVTLPPKYANGWNYDKIAPSVPELAAGEEVGEVVETDAR